VFQIASIDYDTVVNAAPVPDDFLGSCGHTDPFSSPAAGDSDDNHLMDLDMEPLRGSDMDTNNLAPADCP